MPHEKLPEAYAILDSQQPGCAYPEKILCGSGVVYKLIQALYKKFEIKDGMEKWSLDMVGLATLSDMVPLIGENRILASYGLKVMRKNMRVGLQQLFHSLKLDSKTVSEDDIQFLVTPRINAASRMADPVIAFELLSTDDVVKAKSLCKVLTDINTERKVQVALISKEIKKNYDNFDSVPLIVVGNPNWKPALLGLVANSLMRDYNKLAFVWGRDEEGVIKGSCRSNGSYHLVDLMNAVQEGVFKEAGGHAMSGGFAVADEHIHLISDHLVNAISKVSITDVYSAVEVDSLLKVSDINWKFWDSIEKMAPFGVSNSKPLFMLQKVTVVGYKKFGKAEEHVEVRVGDDNGAILPAISFFSDIVVEVNDVIDMVATVEKSSFKGRPEIRLRIVDIIKL